MKKILLQLRLLAAEKLLSLAMYAAPKNTTEGKDIVIMFAEYCKKHSDKMKI